MRTHGHKEGNNTHWGLWVMGDEGSKPPCHVCTNATVLHDLYVYPRT